MYETGWLFALNVNYQLECSICSYQANIFYLQCTKLCMRWLPSSKEENKMKSKKQQQQQKSFKQIRSHIVAAKIFLLLHVYCTNIYILYINCSCHCRCCSRCCRNFQHSHYYQRGFACQKQTLRIGSIGTHRHRHRHSHRHRHRHTHIHVLYCVFKNSCVELQNICH